MERCLIRAFPIVIQTDRETERKIDRKTAVSLLNAKSCSGGL